MLSEKQYTNLVDELFNSAAEIYLDDQEILEGYDGFIDVMWSDDDDLGRYGASSEEFREALTDAYYKLLDARERGRLRARQGEPASIPARA
jgi:hypothetical protein